MMDRIFRCVILVIALQVSVSIPEASLVIGPFGDWGADGILIGRIAAIQPGTTREGGTIDIEVDLWIRNRTISSRRMIRASWYERPSCLPDQPREKYQLGSKYLFLVRKPHDEGLGNNPYWYISLQHALDGSSVCLDRVDVLVDRFEPAYEGCVRKVTEDLLLDGLRTVDRCFRTVDDPIRGAYPVEETCSEQELKTWSARSPLHEMLVRRARQRVQVERANRTAARP